MTHNKRTIKKWRWIAVIAILLAVTFGAFKQSKQINYEAPEIMTVKNSDIENIMSRAEFKAYMENQAKQINLDEKIIAKNNEIKALETELEILRKEEMAMGSLKSATEQSE